MSDRMIVIGIAAHLIQEAGEDGEKCFSGRIKDVLAVQRAGALPFLIPPVFSQDEMQAVLASIDGIYLTGGGDIAGEYYAEAHNPLINRVSHERDEFELPLTRLAIESGKPLLAVCRGIQVLNVAAGGTLYADIPTQLGGSVLHSPMRLQPMDSSAHPVRLEKDSLIGQIMGSERIITNSFHHQGVRKLAPGLMATAWTRDGLIEAIEKKDHPFCLGVQWHPEEEVGNQPGMEKIFNAFIRAAQKQRQVVREPG